MQGQGWSYSSVVKGKRRMCLGVNDLSWCWRVIVNPCVRASGSSVLRLRDYPSPKSWPWRWGLWHTPGLCHCHANSCLETIPAPFQHLSNAHFVPYQLGRIQNPEASGFSSCISHTKRKCCCEYNRKKQMMITKGRAQGILSGSRLGWRKKTPKLLQPSKSGNSMPGLINISFLFIEHLSFWGSVVFIN